MGQADTFSFASRKGHTKSLKSTGDPPRHIAESDSTSDVTCACDPSMYYKVKLPSLCGEGMIYVIGASSVPITASYLVAPEKFYESLIDTVSIVIKVGVCVHVYICVQCVYLSMSMCVYICLVN